MLRPIVGLLIAVAIIAGILWLRTRRVRPIEFKSTQEKMSWLADQAVRVARENQGVELDYTPESIEQVEQVLSVLHDEHKSGKLSKGVNGLALAFGAYIGEAIRQSEPGSKWEKDHQVAGPESYPIQWGGGESFPTGWAYKRIINGPEDNVWHKYVILKQQREKDERTGGDPVQAPE